MRIESVSEMGDVSKVTNHCPLCQKLNEVIVPTEAFKRWAEFGENIQDVMPELSPEDREILISGTDPDCWQLLTEEDDD